MSMVNKQFGVMLKSLTTVMLSMLGAIACVGQDSTDFREKTKLVDRQTIDISNALFRQDKECSAAFESIYQGFIESHSINDEGQFIEGGSTVDGLVARAYFMDYVSKGKLQKVITVARRCANCKGNGKIWVKVDPENPLSLSKVEIDCPECPPDGRVPVEVTFTLVCSPKSVPVLPEKPRVVRQKALVSKANAGDVPSQLEYASQLETGILGVPKDVQLSNEYFIKAAVQGSKQGLEGVLRTIGSTPKNAKVSEFTFIVRLVIAKIGKATSDQDSYYVNTEELGVDVPAGMSYLDVRTMEIIARTFYSYYKSKDLKPANFTYEGALSLLGPIKRQMEKATLASARSKVEYVLISKALSSSNESFDQESMALIKQAAVSIDPVALAILGEISASGLSGKRNAQAAAIFYNISHQVRPDRLIGDALSALDSRYDAKIVGEMVEEFSKTKVAGQANINFIEAMIKIENKNDVIAK